METILWNIFYIFTTIVGVKKGKNSSQPYQASFYQAPEFRSPQPKSPKYSHPWHLPVGAVPLYVHSATEDRFKQFSMYYEPSTPALH